MATPRRAILRSLLLQLLRALQAVPEGFGRHAEHHVVRIAGHHRLERREQRGADVVHHHHERASSVTRVSGMIRREWWWVTPQGRMASNSGCTEVLVEGASTPNLPRGPSESVTALECHSPEEDHHEPRRVRAEAEGSRSTSGTRRWRSGRRRRRTSRTSTCSSSTRRSVRRDEAIAEMKRLQSASADAWTQMMKGRRDRLQGDAGRLRASAQGLRQK